MQSWMEGYTSDIEYTNGYYKELSPSFLNLCLLTKEIRTVDLEKKFTYLELGCGKGYTALINAALFPNGLFYAVDYNPAHIANATQIAQEANLTNIIFLENSFQDLADNPDLLPKFDFIVFHGIYTWVNDKNRENLIKICSNHAKSGAIVYNSYNAKPGWSSTEPFQQMIKNFSKELGGTVVEKFNNSIKLIEKISKFNSGYFKNYSNLIKARLDKIKKSDVKYAIHEYMNDDWKPFFFTEVAEKFADAKFSFVTETKPYFSFFEKDINSLIANYANFSNPMNLELVKDLAFNKTFRKDIYVRGVRGKISGYDKMQALLKLKWVIINRKVIPKDYVFKFNFGTVNGKKEIYGTVVENLSTTPISGLEIKQKTKLDSVDIIKALMVLYEINAIEIFNKKGKNKALELNKVFISRMFENDSFNLIIAPNLNTALEINNSFWLYAYYNGKKNQKEMVEFIYSVFNNRNVKVESNKKILKDSELKEYLTKSYKEWEEKVLPTLKRYGIVK